MKDIVQMRDYEYVCPECRHKLPPVDSQGREILNKMCVRVKRHKSKQPVRMQLKKIGSLKMFKFKVSDAWPWR